MADQAQGADWNAQAPKRGMQTLWRLAVWGSLATLALLLAVMTAYSSAGPRRQLPTGEGIARSPALPGDFPVRTGDAEETRRLMEAVRTLTVDRDRAFARIAALERNLDSITGSIKRTQQQNGQGATQAQQSQAVPTAPQPPAQPAPSPVTAASPPQEPPAAPGAPPRAETPSNQVAAASEQVTYPARPQTTAPPPVIADANRLAASEGANRLAAIAPAPPRSSPPLGPPTAGLGLDIGGATNYEGLRTLWHSTKNSDIPLTEDLYPLVAVRENGRTHGIDLRLVIGPIDDMETASRLCAELSAVHRYCQPVAFEGQRLTLNEPAIGRATPVRHLAPRLDPNRLDPNRPDAAKAGARDGSLQLPK